MTTDWILSLCHAGSVLDAWYMAVKLCSRLWYFQMCILNCISYLEERSHIHLYIPPSWPIENAP